MANISLKLEHALAPLEKKEISNLLEQCFPNTFEGRIFYKQRPHFRLLAHSQGALIGQVGVDSRVIRVAEHVIPIFGIVDLSVRPDVQGMGIGTQILGHLKKISMASDIAFTIAMADKHEVYFNNGFTKTGFALTTFLAIDEVKSHSLIERDFTDIFLVKSTSNEEWPSGNIDMLGYLF